VTDPHAVPLASAQNASAVERAMAFGVDVTLLIENLRYSPTERLRRGEQVLASVVAFKEEVQRARQRQKGKM
jgi:hypothetical protein